ncbi:DUF5682 family protein [Nonomuraea pusilla]|uniref:Uncharacterized protein n=1 Tax=Nonomuraea pusilla TaxID=46177 RepID=A0A1H7L3Q9_9ACTN|nr:DUF5682 family protein [Nonomuraea pusilla]SEK93669.1 hypothetical protein SAMN05660976_01453 [Nonomuraea pusilla]
MSAGRVTSRADVAVLGVRHHGPGSARAVRAELGRLRPDLVLVEGPPEADALAGLAPELEPPVALLAHVPGGPGRTARAAFWPFAVFSPEWQALLYAAEAGVPARFCDLPAAHSLAEPADDVPDGRDETGRGEHAPGGRGGSGPGGQGDAGPGGDPVGALARAAGYDDPEHWWEDVVEHRGDTPFAVIAEAMAAVRQGYEPGPGEARREAYMRRTVRAALKEGFRRVAVVCGAWHVPALTGPPPPVAADNALLRGLPKVKAELTWVPWTYGRLAARSGYGAGVTSPGWYHHLFAAPDRPVERWLTDAAATLRDEGIAVSSAHVIESVRLAEGLAALRGRPLAGLGEVTEAARAVLCEGDDLAVELIRRRMVVGDRLGRVSDGTPMVPLQRDLRDQQRRLRLKPEALDRELQLDLRKPLDLGRSQLLHRLRLLGVGWGTPEQSRGKGTFRETWTLRWEPQHDLTLVERAALGTTVAAAAAQHASELAAEGTAALADLTALVEHCLLAHLPEALPGVLAALSAKAALDTDVTRLMAALPAMVRALRYGDVRGTSAEGLAAIVESMLDRIRVGLPVAVTGLDDEAATRLLTHIDAVHTAVALLSPPGPEHGTAPADPPATADAPVPPDGAAPPGRAARPGRAAPRGGAAPLDGAVPVEGAGRAAPAAPADAPVPPDGAASPDGLTQGDRRGRLAQGGDLVSADPAGSGGRVVAGEGRRAGAGALGGDGRERWVATLRGLCDRQDLHGLVEGRLTRILLDDGELDDAADRLSRATSRGQGPARVAAWVEGFLSGGGLLLVHDQRLLGLVDRWLTGLTGEEFTQALPLLRRTFAGFAAPERRAIGERVRASGPGGVRAAPRSGGGDLDERRAAGAVATVLAILGRRHD